MSEHTLLVHIGYPKTGTTTLQQFLRVNYKQLLEYGWDYIDLEDVLTPNDSVYRAEPEKNGDVLYCLDKSTINPFFMEDQHYLPHLMHAYFDSDAPHLKRIYAYVKEHLENNHVIISSEDLVADYLPIVADLNKHFTNLKIIVYLRRQDLQSESYFAQIIKAPTTLCECHYKKYNFMQENLRYDIVLDEISKVIGTENIIVRPYDKAQFEAIDNRQDIITDFLSCLNINSMHDFEQIPNANSSIWGNYLEMRRLMNETCNHATSSYDNLYDSFMKIATSMPTNKPCGIMSQDMRKAYMNEYEKCNSYVAQKYLSKGTNSLFTDNNLEIDTWNDKISSYEADLTRMFTGILCEQSKTIRGLRARIACLELSQKKQKPYLFIGAGGRSVEAIEEYHLSPEVILDNDLSKNDTILCQVPVKHPTNYPDWKNCALIVTPECCYSMESWLKQEGLLYGQDYLTLNEILYT